MSPDSPSNIRVFIHWHDQTVFAGEEVRCTITFKNVTRAPGSSSNQSKPAPHQSRHLNSNHLHGQNRAKPPSGLVPPPAARGHRSSLSLTVPSAAASSRARAGSIPWSSQSPTDGSSGNGRGGGHSHRRSVSIVSMGSSSGAADDAQSNGTPGKTQRPTRGHARASSLQIVARGNGAGGPRSAPHSHRSFAAQPSPLFNSTYPPNRNTFTSGSSGATTAPSTPAIGSSISSPRSGPNALSDFKFPMAPPPPPDTQGGTSGPGDDFLTSPTSFAGHSADLPSRPKDQVPVINEHTAAPAARILSTTSIAGTPRSSGEFYSLSNHSSETLASEYVTQQQPLRGQVPSPHTRRTSNLANQSSARYPETLMMGYAQIQGSFALDGSLVNLGPFDQVKRKAVVGGQGGGVVGVETSRRDSGLLRGFGWGNLTNSIGELLGGNELSTIKEMRGIASTKSIPLLSTPQSILFVDLKLAPGESKAYEYSFRLPRGLPPTHRGRAMKISYSLVIGTQRPGGVKEQQVKSVDIPFRVLGSVNSHGEILGHDLMSPYIILQDQACVRTITKSHHSRDSRVVRGPVVPAATTNSFFSYVEELLARSQEGPNAALLSPTGMPSSRRPSVYSAFEDASATAPGAKEAIDLAILRANMTASGQQASNRFEIARNGRRLGVVMLARPAYRLGEAVTMAVDFSGAEIPCYAVHAALETTERVDPGLALRSEASVHRVTRKIHVSSSEATLYARRAVFSPTIPVTATPEFVTSGVSLEWKIRLEFVVPAQDDGDLTDNRDRADRDDEEGDDDTGDGGGGHGQRPGGNHHWGPHPLLEEISRDDRGGLVLVAAENIACESFEVAVPLRVYGAVCAGLERLEKDAALEEGLVV